MQDDHEARPGQLARRPVDAIGPIDGVGVDPFDLRPAGQLGDDRGPVGNEERARRADDPDDQDEPQRHGRLPAGRRNGRPARSRPEARGPTQQPGARRGCPEHRQAVDRLDRPGVAAGWRRSERPRSSPRGRTRPSRSPARPTPRPGPGRRLRTRTAARSRPMGMHTTTRLADRAAAALTVYPPGSLGSSRAMANAGDPGQDREERAAPAARRHPARSDPGHEHQPYCQLCGSHARRPRGREASARRNR